MRLTRKAIPIAQKADNGIVYVGAVFPDSDLETKVQLFDKPIGDALGHVLGVCTYQPDDTFVYYWGSGWSKYGFPSDKDWTDYLKSFSQQVRNPLEVSIAE